MAVGAPGGRVLAASHVAQALALGQALVQLKALPCCHDKVAGRRGAPEEAEYASATFRTLHVLISLMLLNETTWYRNISKCAAVHMKHADSSQGLTGRIYYA